MKTIKIQNAKIYPQGAWRVIASEREQSTIDDESVYFYLSTDKEVNNIKSGDLIELDEQFKVLEIKEE